MYLYIHVYKLIVRFFTLPAVQGIEGFVLFFSKSYGNSGGFQEFPCHGLMGVIVVGDHCGHT